MNDLIIKYDDMCVGYYTKPGQKIHFAKDGKSLCSKQDKILLCIGVKRKLLIKNNICSKCLKLNKYNLDKKKFITKEQINMKEDDTSSSDSDSDSTTSISSTEKMLLDIKLQNEQIQEESTIYFLLMRLIDIMDKIYAIKDEYTPECLISGIKLLLTIFSDKTIIRSIDYLSKSDIIHLMNVENFEENKILLSKIEIEIMLSNDERTLKRIKGENQIKVFKYNILILNWILRRENTSPLPPCIYFLSMDEKESIHKKINDTVSQIRNKEYRKEAYIMLMINTSCSILNKIFQSNNIKFFLKQEFNNNIKTIQTIKKFNPKYSDVLKK
jgi:hypothetical protein